MSEKNDAALEVLNAELQRRGMSRATLAALLGRSSQYITDIFKGKKQFTVRLAVELEAALGIQLSTMVEAIVSHERQNIAARLDVLKVAAQQHAKRTQLIAKRKRISTFKRKGKVTELSEEQVDAINKIIGGE